MLSFAVRMSVNIGLWGSEGQGSRVRIAALAATAAFAIQLQRWPGSQNKPTSPQVAAWKPLLVKVRNAAKVLVVRISY